MRLFKYLTVSFFLFLAPVFLHSFESGTEYTNIYSDDTSSAFMLNFNMNIENPNIDFFYNTNVNYIKSDFSAINSDCALFNFSTGYKCDLFCINPQFGVFQTSEVKLDIGNKFSNKGLSLLYSGIQIPLYFYELQIKPFFYFATLNAKEGDLAYFMGYPKIPYAFASGAEISFNKNFFCLFYAPFNLKILSNDRAEQLFSSDNFFIGALYSYSFFGDTSLISYKISPFASYLYASGDFSGALTQQNQQALYFVFDYFKVTSSYNAHLCTIGASGLLSTNNLKFKLDTAIFFCLSQDSITNTEWKKLEGLSFWQKYIWESLEIEDTGEKKYKWSELDKAGIVYINVGLEYSFYKKYGTAYFYKKFIIPFSLQHKSDGTPGTVVDISEIDSKTVVNYLLSGISLGISLKM